MGNYVCVRELVFAQLVVLQIRRQFDGTESGSFLKMNSVLEKKA